MPFTPSANLAHQIARDLGDRIIHTELKPGERIIEEKLARELGVSISPLREALRILEKDGLVELKPRRGTSVTVLTRAHVACMYDILTELYALVVRNLIECATDDAVRQVDAAIKDLERCAQRHDVEGYYNAIFDFGAVALQCVRMPLLERMIMELWPTKRRVEYHMAALRRNDLVENANLFRQTFQYLLAGDVERAVQTFRTYTQGEKEYALKHIPLG